MSTTKSPSRASVDKRSLAKSPVKRKAEPEEYCYLADLEPNSRPEKKSRSDTPRPSPGSESFVRLPAVSITAIVDAALRGGFSHTFGTIDGACSDSPGAQADDEASSPVRDAKDDSGHLVVPDVRPVRNKQKTEKARVLATEQQRTSPRRGKRSISTVEAPLPAQVREKDSGIERDLDPLPIIPVDKSPVRRTSKRRKRAIPVVSEDIPVVSEDVPVSGKTVENEHPSVGQVRGSQRALVEFADPPTDNPPPLKPAFSPALSTLVWPSSPEENPSVLDVGDRVEKNRDSSVELSNTSPTLTVKRNFRKSPSPDEDGSPVYGDYEGFATPTPNVSRSLVQATEEKSGDLGIDDDNFAVVNKQWQDPLLYDIYKGLPYLKSLCTVQPFGYNNGEEGPRVSFSTLCQALSKSSIISLTKGLVFDKSGDFVNTSRVPPNALQVDSQRLKIAGSTHMAVGIMLGVVTECCIVTPGTGGSLTNPYPVRKISIAPFPQEFRRDTSLWGELFKFKVVSGPLSASGFSFLSRKSQAPPSTPTGAANNAFATTPKKVFATSPKKAAPINPLFVRSTASYPPSRGFDDNFPIYDGRDSAGMPFRFTDQDFQRLSSMSLYKNGAEDLPVNALVAVGYTLNVYSSESSGSLIISSNLQFVILIGMPKTVPLT